jgi:hypothetical protein
VAHRPVRRIRHLRYVEEAMRSLNLDQELADFEAACELGECRNKQGDWEGWIAAKRAALAQSPVNAEGLTDTDRIDYIDRKGVAGYAYKGVGSVDTIIRVEEYRAGGLRWAIDCMIKREPQAIAAVDKGTA